MTIIGSETLAKPSGQYLSQNPANNHLAVYRRVWMNTESPCLPEEVDVVLGTSPSIVDGVVKYGISKDVFFSYWARRLGTMPLIWGSTMLG